MTTTEKRLWGVDYVFGESVCSVHFNFAHKVLNSFWPSNIHHIWLMKLEMMCFFCSTASSEWGATITVCGLAASSSLTSPPSCHGMSRSTRRQSAVPPMASNISLRGRSVGGWVRKMTPDPVFSFCLLSLFLPFYLFPLVPCINPQVLNIPTFDNIVPGELCGLKVLRWESCRLIFVGYCKRISSVLTKGETSVGKHSASCYVCCLRGLIGFCCCVLHIHNGTSSPRGSLACTIWAIMSKGGNHIQVVFFFLLALSEMSN